jgi:AraC family transcriptional regulator of adaptative response/methylated-DNA-[protein]-cysteine methyltransferase
MGSQTPGTELEFEERWKAVEERSRRDDGRFVFAVRTTGVYCRPSCPARRPRRENVEFFNTAPTARAAGYRPCRRCAPDGSTARATGWIATVCRLLDQPGANYTLAELGRAVGLSPSHLQRTFTREVGVSPRQYGLTRRLQRLRTELGSDGEVSRAVYEAGFESSSVAYAHAASGLGMTPKRWRDGGRGAVITFTIVPSDLGEVLVAATERGIVAVRIGRGDEMIARLAVELPEAELRQDDRLMAPQARVVLDGIVGGAAVTDLPVDIAATAFQARVWTSLRAIPVGQTRSYAEVAQAIGAPTAVRAVASACAANPVALVVPCHRVVRSDGSLGGYRWGEERKAELLRREREAAAEG